MSKKVICYNIINIIIKKVRCNKDLETKGEVYEEKKHYIDAIVAVLKV